MAAKLKQVMYILSIIMISYVAKSSTMKQSRFLVETLSLYFFGVLLDWPIKMRTAMYGLLNALPRIKRFSTLTGVSTRKELIRPVSVVGRPRALLETICDVEQLARYSEAQLYTLEAATAPTREVCLVLVQQPSLTVSNALRKFAKDSVEEIRSAALPLGFKA